MPTAGVAGGKAGAPPPGDRQKGRGNTTDALLAALADEAELADETEMGPVHEVAGVDVLAESDDSGTVLAGGRAQSFQELVPEPSPQVRAEWFRRIEAEYRAAARTHHLTLWMLQIGAPPELIDAGLRVVSSKLVHAELAAVVYAEAGGSAEPNLDRQTLQLRRDREQTLECDLLWNAFQLLCVGATAEVTFLRFLREFTSEPSARQALERRVKDTRRHRNLGWELLDWLLELPDRSLYRRLLAARLPAAFSSLAGVASDIGLVPDELFQESDRAWGLSPRSDWNDVLEATFQRYYLPRLGKLGIDPQPAWDVRRR